MELLRAKYASPGESGKRGFEDLDCYKLALDVMVNAHQVAKTLPADEKFDLVQQIRRCSKSVPANIAEGYGRYHYLDTLRFYAIARGSLNETLNHFITANVLGYIDQKYFEQVYELTRQAERTLNGIINYVRTKKSGSNLFGDKLVKEESPGYVFDAVQFLEHE
ncbi:MAG: four helix bundle protein [Anaerolineae bacterium]|nr:four helix bundle protein [Anaerolineae bacterium]